VNHYCTYFDRSFLIQGLALAASLRRNDRSAVLWVLCLDDFTALYLRERAETWLRPIELSTLETADGELLAIKAQRSTIEYYFTLSPCWPRYLLRHHPEIDRLTYVDADMFFFDDPSAIFSEMESASILVTEHRYPVHLRHHLRYGRFNVGLLSFRNDDVGLDCLDWWRHRCLDWCYDREENGKYGDQKYLDEWPARYGARLCVSRRQGVNLAPWNWSQYPFSFRTGRLIVNDEPIEVFHFARFAPLQGTWLFQSGQLEYGVMPWRVRQWIYGRYWRALRAARNDVARLRPGFGFPRGSARHWHGFWSALVPRVLFGSDWIRIGSYFFSGRLGLGRFSGHLLSWIRGAIRRPMQRLLPVPTPLMTDSPLGPVSLEREPQAVYAAPPQQRE
jgi:hypothetical protein